MANDTADPYDVRKVEAVYARMLREVQQMREGQEAQKALEPAKADEILAAAQETLRKRATTRDQPGGERSMARAVAAFNALTGHKLSTREGWMFMVALKSARACTPGGRHNADDYLDGAAYFALAGEEAEATGP